MAATLARIGPRADESQDRSRRRHPKEAARALTKSGRIEVWDLKEGVAIRTTSWVGSIRLGGLQIDVRPKIQGLALDRILRYALGRKALDGGVHVSTALGSHGLVELLVLQLVEEARVLVRGGLRRGYVSRAEDLLFPRGRIDFHRWASLPRASGAGLPCRFHERSSNVLQNQALLAGLRLGAQLCAGLGAGWEAAETARLLDAEVEEVRLSPEMFDRLIREGTRMTRAYDPALFLVQMLAEGVSAASDTNDKSARVRGFLIDMNVIFQALLGRFLTEELVDKHVSLEPHITGFFTWDDDAGRTPPFLKPDFVVKQGRTVVGLLDAKYRDLSDGDVPAGWLYQLAIYALSRPEDEREAVILYPTLASSVKERTLRIRTTGAPHASVRVRPVPIADLAEVLAATDGPGRSKRRALAEQLASRGTAS